VDENQMKKRLFTCGDSYMTLDHPQKEVTSFLQMFAEYKGFDHVSLGRAGATIFLIRLQIDYAIANGADYVIVGCTSSDRMDIPVRQDGDIINYLTMENILLKGYKSQVEATVRQHRTMVISDTIVNLLHSNHERMVTDEQKTAIKNYVADLHNSGLKRQENFYVLSDGLRKLQQARIPFVYIPHGMAYMDWSWVDCVWPKDQLPCLMPKGPYDYEKSVTHNDQECHDNFLEILKSMTMGWR
jgi:hypothetical protein